MGFGGQMAKLDIAKVDDQRGYNFNCPACQSPKGKKCTEATETGRKTVSYIHFARTNQIDGDD